MFQEGDAGEEFFIIEQGVVECLKLHQVQNRKGFLHVRELKAGDHFGELALINNEKRSLSIRVVSNKCKLLKLDRETFTRILGSIQGHLKKDYNKEFDSKMEAMKQERRTLSQTFDKELFSEIQLTKDVKESCKTRL